MSVSELSQEGLSRLEAQVRAHRVTYESRPAYRIVDGERQAIGFDLTLCGTHPDGAEHVLPGCRHCHGVWSALGNIARAIVPPSDRASMYTIRGFDHAFHMAAARGFRNDLEMVLEIRHRDGYLDSIDDCERRCLDEIKADLSRLGVPHRVWRD